MTFPNNKEARINHPTFLSKTVAPLILDYFYLKEWRFKRVCAASWGRRIS